MATFGDATQRADGRATRAAYIHRLTFTVALLIIPTTSSPSFAPTARADAIASRCERADALSDAAHTSHRAAWVWFQKHGQGGWASCSITQNGSVRILAAECLDGDLSLVVTPK